MSKRAERAREQLQKVLKRGARKLLNSVLDAN